MLPILLLAGGATLALWCLGRLRRSLTEANTAHSRLEAITDELIATAEATVEYLSGETERLQELLRRAAAQRRNLESLLAAAPALQAGSSVRKAAAFTQRTTVAALPEPPSATGIQPIIELSDRGYDAPAIARQLGRTKAEVELVLGLRAAAHQ